MTHRPELSRTKQPDRSVDAPPTQRLGSRWSRRQAEAEGGRSPDRTVQRGPREAGPDTPTSRSSGANESYQELVGRAGRGGCSPRPAPCVLVPTGPRFRFPRLSSPTVAEVPNIKSGKSQKSTVHQFKVARCSASMLRRAPTFPLHAPGVNCPSVGRGGEPSPRQRLYLHGLPARSSHSHLRDQIRRRGVTLLCSGHLCLLSGGPQVPEG